MKRMPPFLQASNAQKFLIPTRLAQKAMPRLQGRNPHDAAGKHLLIKRSGTFLEKMKVEISTRKGQIWRLFHRTAAAVIRPRGLVNGA